MRARTPCVEYLSCCCEETGVSSLKCYVKLCASTFAWTIATGSNLCTCKWFLAILLCRKSRPNVHTSSNWHHSLYIFRLLSRFQKHPGFGWHGHQPQRCWFQVPQDTQTSNTTVYPKVADPLMKFRKIENNMCWKLQIIWFNLRHIPNTGGDAGFC